jgi:sulfur carrier protein
MPLTLILNGQSRTFDSLSEPATLDQLVAELGLKSDRVAIEYNGDIAPRSAWPQTTLSAGDRLEVVHFVGGGVIGATNLGINVVRGTHLNIARRDDKTFYSIEEEVLTSGIG